MTLQPENMTATNSIHLTFLDLYRLSEGVAFIYDVMTAKD
jgi:hypothetical protein